jgi:dTDP-glucose pyrophosphorylase
MILIVSMAGRYVRFRESGYTVPKYLLPWEDRPMLASVLEGLLEGDAFSEVLLVANLRDREFEPDIRRVLWSAGLPDGSLVFIDDTAGQAQTALLGVRTSVERGTDPATKVCFHNTDTILHGRDFASVDRALDDHAGYIDVFAADNPQYAYVVVSPEGLVSAVAEKHVISPTASSGFYGFESLDTYLDRAQKSTWKGEFYVIDVYRSMIASGARIAANAIEPGHETIVLGTPLEYQAALAARRGE